MQLWRGGGEGRPEGEGGEYIGGERKGVIAMFFYSGKNVLLISVFYLLKTIRDQYLKTSIL